MAATLGGLGLHHFSAGGHNSAVHCSQKCPGVIEKHTPRWKEVHSARGTFEERGTEFVFEGSNVAAERRLRHMEALGSAANVALFGNHDKVADLRKAHT